MHPLPIVEEKWLKHLKALTRFYSETRRAWTSQRVTLKELKSTELLGDRTGGVCIGDMGRTQTEVKEGIRAPH